MNEAKRNEESDLTELLCGGVKQSKKAGAAKI